MTCLPSKRRSAAAMTSTAASYSADACCAQKLLEDQMEEGLPPHIYRAGTTKDGRPRFEASLLVDTVQQHYALSEEEAQVILQALLRDPQGAKVSPCLAWCMLGWAGHAASMLPAPRSARSHACCLCRPAWGSGPASAGRQVWQA